MIKIDNHTISEAEFDRACGEYSMRLGGKKMVKGEYSAIANQLIDAYLFIEDAKKIGLEVADSEVEATISQVIARYPNKETFEAALKQIGDSVDSFCAKVKNDMLLRKYLQRSFYNKVEIDETEVKGIYEANKAEFVAPEQVKASHILVKEASDADDLLKQLKDGADFGELAKKHSTCPSGAKGGDLGFFKRGSMVKPFEEAAFAMKAGELSVPVPTQFGVHLIKVTERRDGGAMAFAEAKEIIEQQLGQRKLAESMGQKVEELRGAVSISIDEAVLAKKGE